MKKKRFLRCTHLYSDGVGRLNDVKPLPDGRLFSYSICRRIDTKSPVTQMLYGRISSDGGKTWSPSGFFYEMPERDISFFPGDFMIDRQDRIHIFLLRIKNIDVDNPKNTIGAITYLRLDNEKGDGLLYQPVVECLNRYTGSMNNCIQTAKGRLIAPFSTIAGINGSVFVSSVIYSDDGGESWSASNDVSVVSLETNLESGAVEPVVAEVGEGVLIMLIRTVLKCFYYSVSYDDGATWSEAKPTRITSSNAPGVPVSMPDGRIVYSWNNVLGQPMAVGSEYYSFARQVLHAAVSFDGLKTLEGARAIIKKRVGDPDGIVNCYPFGSPRDDNSIFLRPMSATDMERTTWNEPEGMLLVLNPEQLLDREMHDAFDEWVTDCPVDENGICLAPTIENTAFACVNMPYARKGEIRLKASGAIPKGFRVILSDCYIDRSTFTTKTDGYHYKAAIGEHLTELLPKADGSWVIRWDKDSVQLEENGCAEVYERTDKSQGFNHLALVFEGEGEINISDFHMEAYETGFSTGIEY